ncbi:hypothetical protein [Streptomyces sp. NPDC053048]|uniref:hypothetical protein n=1 Tax=Streptomyces sp. NPDC053048 TaxID=3365694 RepID=UPI0037D7683F
MALRHQVTEAGRIGRLGGVRGARAQANAVFATAGHGRVNDPAIGRVQRTRAVLGALSTFGLVSVYGVDGGWSEVFTDGLAKLLVAPLVLILVGPLVIAAFIWYAPPRHRPLLRSRLRIPLKAIGWYLGVPLGAVGGFLGLLMVARLLEQYTVAQMVVFLVALVVGIPFVVWAVAFVFYSSAPAARYAFNTADVHAALPAVLTAVLVWVLNLVQLGDGLPNGPVAVQIAAFLGGPLSVTAVSWWELHVLRTRYGVRVRG